MTLRDKIKFKNTWEIQTRKQLFLQLFCPYAEKEILEAIELCIKYNKDEKWLFNLVKKHKKPMNLIELIESNK